MAWYTTGTIAVSGTTVTGTGTNFLDNTQSIGPGQALLIPGSGTVKMYEVASVQSATKLTLKTSPGTIAAGQAYAILSFYTDSAPDFARRLAAQLSYYQSQMDGWQQIMTGTGSITMTAPDGTTVTISSFAKLTADVATANSALNNFGYGLAVSPLITGFDWQQADFLTGQLLCFQFSASSNPPADAVYNSGTTVTVEVIQNRGNLIVVRMTSLTASVGNKRVYNVVISGVKGSRTFKSTQLYNDDTSSIIPLSNGGTGSSTPFGTAANTFTQGNDSRLNTVNGKTGGTLTSELVVNGSGIKVSGATGATSNTASLSWVGGSGAMDIVDNRGSGTGGILLRVVNSDNSANIAVYNLQSSGIGLAPGGWQTGSDERIKEDIQDIDPTFALDAVINMRHVTFKMRDRPDGDGGWIKGERSAGYLAQDLEKYLPEAVSTAKSPKTFDEDGNQTGFPYKCQADDGSVLEIEDMKSVDPGKAAAALNGAAIKALYEIIQKQDAVIAELQGRMKAIDGLDA